MLTKLDRPGDLDNTTTLSVMEKKLSRSDRVKWADYQEDKGVSPKIESFLKWMEREVRKRKMAGADIRSQRILFRNADNKSSINTIAFTDQPNSENPSESLHEDDQVD